jgi:hypothetical protein
MMRKLLSFKIQALKFADHITGTLKEIVNDAGSINNDISTSQLTVNINKVEEAGLSLYAKLFLLSPELKDEYAKIRGLHTFGIPAEDSPVVANITIHVKNGSVDEILKKVNDFLDDPENRLASVRSLFSAKAEGHDRICFGVSLPFFGKGSRNPILDMGKEIITKVQDELKVDQSVEVNIRLATSPAELLAAGAEPFILQLLKGIQLNVKINVWKKLADVMMKLVEAGEIDSSLLPFLGGLGPAALLKVKGNLDIEVDDHMKNMITSNPLVEPLLMDAQTLIASVSGVSDDDEMDSFIDDEL